MLKLRPMSVSTLNNDVCVVDQVAGVEPSDLGKTSADVLMREQREDSTLASCWKLANLNKPVFISTTVYGFMLNLCSVKKFNSYAFL
jgi:hypothetical protein